MWRGERSSWRCSNNGRCRGITSMHRGITKVHSGAARRRRRRIINPIHAALVKGWVTISKAALKSKAQGGPNKYTSPLDAPRAGSSGFRKRSSSPYRRGAKRGRGGRGAAPSSTRGRGFRRLGVIPLSNRYRRLSVAPMAHLERRGRRSLGVGGSVGRIQHSFPEGSHFIQGAHPFFGLLSQIHPGQSVSAGGGVSAPEGSHQAGSTSFTVLLQLVICSDEGLGVVTTSDRSFLFEPQGVEDTFQDGDSPIHSVVGPQRGLDSLHRSQRCISSDSNTSGIQKISEVHGLREGLSIQGPLLWSVHGSSGLHAGHGSGFGNSSQSWHSSPTFSGRLADSGVLPGAGSPGFEDSSLSMQLWGLSSIGRNLSLFRLRQFVIWESFWTQSISGLLQARNESTSCSQLATCFYPPWSSLQNLGWNCWEFCPL